MYMYMYSISYIPQHLHCYMCVCTLFQIARLVCTVCLCTICTCTCTYSNITYTCHIYIYMSVQKFFRLTNLRKLSLSENDLVRIPPNIANLTKLAELDVSKNGNSSLFVFCTCTCIYFYMCMFSVHAQKATCTCTYCIYCVGRVVPMLCQQFE